MCTRRAAARPAYAAAASAGSAAAGAGSAAAAASAVHRGVGRRRRRRAGRGPRNRPVEADVGERARPAVVAHAVARARGLVSDSRPRRTVLCRLRVVRKQRGRCGGSRRVEGPSGAAAGSAAAAAGGRVSYRGPKSIGTGEGVAASRPETGARCGARRRALASVRCTMVLTDLATFSLQTRALHSHGPHAHKHTQSSSELSRLTHRAWRAASARPAIGDSSAATQRPTRASRCRGSRGGRGRWGSASGWVSSR